MSALVTAAVIFLVPTGALLAMAAHFIYASMHRTPKRWPVTGRAAVPYQRPSHHFGRVGLVPVATRR